MLRLSNVDGIELHEEHFKQRVKFHGGDLGAVFVIVNKMAEATADDDPDNEVFFIQKESLTEKMKMEVFL